MTIVPGAFTGNDSVGEVYVQIDLFTYAASGEHKVTVKGKKMIIVVGKPIKYL